MRSLSLRPRVAMAVYAHPDDADVAAGGVMALWASQGSSLHLVVVCDGSKGAHGPQTTPDRLREVRRAELQLAADLIGVSEVHVLEVPDGNVTNSDELRATLVGLIRGVRPDVVLGPDPTATFFGGVYVNHRDHRETGWALLDAVAPAAAMPLYYPEQGDAHQVKWLLLSGTHEPDVAIDVASSIDVKVKAVLAHHSQTGDDAEGVSDVVRGRAAQAGRALGLSYAEAFRSVELSG
ncbi:MAG: PIG-L family deacetylase [Actinomycetota bacterium]|nr:PIG-L family deacetylase [Actinomycetota bacterium]